MMDMKGGMDPGDISRLTGEGPPPRRPRSRDVRRGSTESRQDRLRGATRNRAISRRTAQGRNRATRLAERIVRDRTLRGVGPGHIYVEPQDVRPIWNPHTHGEQVIYWHRIFKYSFKTLFMIAGTNSYIATAVGALTVRQLFGTLDQLLITIVSVAIGSTCAGVATYTGAAAATVALYTLIRGVYDRIVGQSREEVQVNVAAQCREIDQNIRGHVIGAGQDLTGLFNSPGFLQLIDTINSTADFASGACAGLLTGKFIRRTYRPPAPPAG